MYRYKLVLGVVVLLAAGCATTPDAVPLEAEPPEAIVGAGTWQGRYQARGAAGRAGLIHFTVQEGRDTAHGYITLTPGTPAEQRAAGTQPAAPAGTERLHIAFVRAENGTLVGELDPYTDPVCGCRLRTTFVGTISPKRIRGTFTTEHLDTHTVVRGVWWTRHTAP